MAGMDLMRRFGSDAWWILVAVVSGALWFGLGSSFTWLQGALAGLAWGSILVLGRRVRQRRAAPPPHTASPSGPERAPAAGP